MASKDGSGASVMLWNWQHTQPKRYRATVDMARVPSSSEAVDAAPDAIYVILLERV